MNEPRSVKERLEQYVLSHPNDSITIEGVASLFGKEHLPAIERAIKEFTKRQSVFKALLLKDSFKVGAYRLNPDYKTLEQMRNEAEAAGRERVVASDRPWDPKEGVIQGTDLSSRRLHFRSILERMAKNPAFSGADIDFLTAENPTLLTEG